MKILGLLAGFRNSQKSNRLVLVLCLLLPFTIISHSGLCKPLKLVATIKPIHSLVTAITTQVSPPPKLLLSGAASPHQYKLKFSDISELKTADIIFATDPELEAFTSGFKNAVYLSQGLNKLKKRGHRPQTDDPHVWLSIKNAELMVESIAKSLIAADPEHKDGYLKNRAETLARLKKMKSHYQAQFATLPKIGYIVFHDAYQYFEKEFGLQPGIIKDRHLLSVNDLIKMNNGTDRGCIIEDKMAGGSHNPHEDRIVRLDPLGRDIESSKDMYFILMSRVGEGFVKCMMLGRKT